DRNWITGDRLAELRASIAGGTDPHEQEYDERHRCTHEPSSAQSFRARVPLAGGAHHQRPARSSGTGSVKSISYRCNGTQNGPTSVSAAYIIAPESRHPKRE